MVPAFHHTMAELKTVEKTDRGSYLYLPNQGFRRIERSGRWAAPGLHKQLAELNHNADHISFAANECPYIGLLGAITGIHFFMTGSEGLGGALDPSHFKEIMSNSLVGLGIAFIPTITGVAEGEDVQIHQRVLTLAEQRREETAFRFTLTKSGEVADINELPKSLIQSGLAENH